MADQWSHDATEVRFDYESYLRTDAWRERREIALEWACHQCQVCNSPHDLVVHHRTYERIGHEDPADLTVLCSGCHDLFHAGGRISGLYVEDDAVL
jgi:5-methylcytosine-specific restriction endonuclease McrA